MHPVQPTMTATSTIRLQPDGDAYFRDADELSRTHGGEVLDGVARLVRKYLSPATTGQQVDFVLDEVQTDLMTLSGLYFYMGTLAARARMNAEKWKAALWHEEQRRAREIEAKQPPGAKISKTQAQLEARMLCAQTEQGHIESVMHAEVLNNACVTTDNLIMTLKKIQQRLADDALRGQPGP